MEKQLPKQAGTLRDTISLVQLIVVSIFLFYMATQRNISFSVNISQPKENTNVQIIPPVDSAQIKK
jgi:hypothetical protein